MKIAHELSKLLPDSIFLKMRYYRLMGKTLNLSNPKTYNEKLQWLKIHDHNPKYIKLVDKYEAKSIVGNLIGEEHIIPTLGVWDSFDKIKFDELPEKFVLKCTHDSGSVVVCKDRSCFSEENAKEVINSSLKKNYYWEGREWAYKKIPHRIIAEEYIEDSITGHLDDYKFFCFDGKVDNVMVVRGRAEGKPLYYHFDTNWNLCRFNRLTRKLPLDYYEEKPCFIDDMISIAEKLSAGFTHVRIDLYEANNKIYFGEFTLYNQSGWETGFDDYSDNYLGSLIHLPIK
jgi:hypothetical protein